jgi:formate dehydrogenase iron-sulfur subunit
MSTLQESSLSRRAFLKQAGRSAAALAAATALATQSQTANASLQPAGDAYGLLIDLTRCTGCNSCALACKAANQLPHADVLPDSLASDAYSFVEPCDVTDEDGGTSICHVKRQCMHCVHPACVSACTVGALRKTPEGPVVYDSDKCIGCRYCQYACPFGVPTYDWDNPLGLISKCEMCVGRLDAGEKPACTAACPNGALRYGRRSQLLAQAHAQIESNPGRYVDHIYGEHEVGGTSILYMSPVPFSELGFPELGSEPIPRYAEAVMVRTPVIALTVASLATGLHLLMKRRAHQAEFVPSVDESLEAGRTQETGESQ